MLELGWQHWQESVKRRLACLLLSHYHGLESGQDTGYAIHEKLLSRILDTGLAELNSKIQLIKSNARGFRSFQNYLELVRG